MRAHRPAKGPGVGLAGRIALAEDLGQGSAPEDWAGSVADLTRAARLKQTLAQAQARAGRFEDACDSAAGVVRAYRRLAEADPDRYRPELALALSAWGIWTSRRGEPEPAARALTDSVGHYRDLVVAVSWRRIMYRIRLRVGLAVTLSNLGLVHAELGRHPAALDAAAEAVGILRRLRAGNPVYRLLARTDPTSFEHCMATLVSNLGVVCASAGRLDTACELAEETVGCYRRLAALAPVVYESVLASALHNLGLASAQVGRLDTALAATQEAVYLHRCVIPVDQREHQRNLGRALCSFATVRVACRRELPEALAAAEEAVRVHEELTAANPESFTGDLHASYRTASQVRRALGNT